MTERSPHRGPGGKPVKLSGTQLTKNRVLAVCEPELFHSDCAAAIPDPVPYTLSKSEAVVAFVIDPYGPSPLRTYLRAEVKLKIEARSPLGSTLPTESVTLTVDYDPSPGKPYRESERRTIIGAASAQVTVNVEAARFFRRDGGREVETLDEELKKRVSLISFIMEERWYKPEPNQAPIGVTSGIDDTMQLRLSWDSIQWAEEYEVEWTHVNDYCRPDLDFCLVRKIHG